MTAAAAALAALLGLGVGLAIGRREWTAWAETMRRWLSAGAAGDLPNAAGLRAAGRGLQADIAALAQERDRLGRVLDVTGEGALLVDAARRVLWCNASARTLLGLDTDPTGQALAQATRHPAVLATVAEVAEERRVVSREAHWPGNPSRRMLVRAAPLDTGVAVLLADFTELRTLETLRRDFVANVSHELRTPLAAVQAAAESLHLALAVDDREALFQFIDIIERKGARLQALVDDLLELAHIERPDYRPDLEAIALRAAAEAAVAALAERIAEQQTHVVILVDTDLRVRAAQKPLHQVLVNLIGNAVAYAGRGAAVQLEVAEAHLDQRASWRVTVADTGPGIATEHLARLFERFYRVDAGRSRETGGTGLGLAIVKHHVESMAGRVGVDSAPGQGARFWIELPGA